MSRPRFLFISAVHPWQYTGLAEYLHREGLAECWQMTTPGHCANHAGKYVNLIPFQPAGPITGKPEVPLRWKLDRATNIARGVVDAVRALPPEQRPDLIIAHAMFGAPHMLYDLIGIPVVTYLEFPSYRAHGQDPAFPPDLTQRLADSHMEMLTLHQVLRSAMTIVPSRFAANMIPTPLRHRVEVQFEGFAPATRLAPAPSDRLTVGFAARDLSNAKGVDRFIRIVAQMEDQGLADAFDFRAIGDPAATTYGYESQAVQRRHKDPKMTYVEHLLREYPAARRISFTNRLPYDDYVKLLNSIDIFLYPLRFGVANWGFMEIMARGGCMIGSRRGFIPEILLDGRNGRLAGEDDAEWIALLQELAQDPAQRRALSDGAWETGHSFRIDRVAPRYLALFRDAMARGNL